ncbi:membrane-spanning 4-domains subfamily A member 8-like [Aquarana catesbeiana]|uniref:membrane-spanning 4-domains subfamily A member 8-like n=1 Tax=Aquarana catesbeiana TaxID=8400 RepID=UPI003CC977F4
MILSEVEPSLAAAHEALSLFNQISYYKQSIVQSCIKLIKPCSFPLQILVIVAAILEIALGIALAFLVLGATLLSGIPFWGPVFYIIAGSLTLAALTKPNICLIKGSLSLNIISSIFSMIAVILNIIDLATMQCYLYSYYYYGYYYNDYAALSLCQQKLDGGYAVLSLLLVINLLLFCVTVSTSVFECRSLSKVQPGHPVNQVFVIQNDAGRAMNPGAFPFPVTTTYAQPSPAPPPTYPYPFNVVKP